MDRIINVDEASIYIDMPQNKTVNIKGVKDIDIITFWGEKVRISVILAITGIGKKLPSILIFKAKIYGNLEKIM